MKKQNESLKNISNSFNYFQKILQNSGPIASTSYSLLASILLGVGFGWYYDNKFLSSPLGILIGLFVGLFIGFYYLAKSIWYKK